MKFEQKLAYDIGTRLAEKQASMQAFKTLSSGLKGVVTGQGATMGKAFEAGAKNVAAKGGATNFRGVMGEIGQGLAKPWQQMYRTYGARQGAKRVQALGQDVTKQQQALAAARKANDPTAVAAAEKALAEAKRLQTTTHRGLNKAFGGGNSLATTARQSYIPRNVDQKSVQQARDAVKHFRTNGTPEQLAAAQQNLARVQRGTVDYRTLGTMATGAGIVGTGTYMLGNAAFGGGNTYVNQVQPQVAPHQYYLNQMSSWFK